jgi:uncharacterized protein YegL
MSDVVGLEQAPLAPPAWKQLAVIVSDGSESMTWDLEPDRSLEAVAAAPVRKKAEGVDVATRDLLNRLKAGRKAANFYFAFVTFNDHVSERRPVKPLLEVSANDSFDPTAGGIGGTRIWTGIEAATELVQEFHREEGQGIPVSAVVLVLSDGEDSEPEKTVESANKLKETENTNLAACLFATKGATNEGEMKGASLLQTVVSEPRLYQTVFTAEQLRDFFHASVTMTAIVGDAAE